MKFLAFVNPGESEGPQVADAMGIYFKDVGIDAEIEVIDWADTRHVQQQEHPVLHLAQYHLVAASGGLDAYLLLQ